MFFSRSKLVFLFAIAAILAAGYVVISWAMPLRMPTPTGQRPNAEQDVTNRGADTTNAESPLSDGPSGSSQESQGGIGFQDALRISPDTDKDGVRDFLDNCPDIANPLQEDSDLNGVGDACHVIEVAMEDLANRLGSTPLALGIRPVEISKLVFPDTCFGLALHGRICEVKETPGYRLSLKTSNSSSREFLYYTDLFSSFVFVGMQEN